MATYNFTVRATDNAGAFADRTFSMNVNDTTATSTYDRFLAIGAGGVSRSTDGITWSAPDGIPSGLNRVVYGNGFWIAFSNNGQYRWAPASTMAWSPLYNLSNFVIDPATSNSSTLGLDIRFRKGKWTAILGYNYSATTWIAEGTTADITTGPTAWTYTRTVAGNLPGISNLPNCSFDYDPVSDTWLTLMPNGTNASGISVLYRRQGTGSWTRIAAPSIASFIGSALAFGSGNIRFTNGLWLISGYADSAGFYTSTDGVSFVYRTVPSGNSGVAPVYQNGRIIGLPMSNGSTGTPMRVYESTNGGRSFVPRGPTSSTFPQAAQVAGSGMYNYLRPITATFGSTTIWSGYSIGAAVQVSNDDFLTSQQVTLPNIGNVFSVAARDS